MKIFRRAIQVFSPQKTPFELRIDGERIAGRLFNKAFGYRAGTTSMRDLLAVGVPITPPCISDDLL